MPIANIQDYITPHYHLPKSLHRYVVQCSEWSLETKQPKEMTADLKIKH